MDENDIKVKVRNLFTKIAKSGEGLATKEIEIIPKSITFTKTTLPILYSNLILIEDMKYENSNYFLGSNGFISKKITLSSLKHDSNFSLSNCVFRIFPRTYNVNKYKVLDFINQKGKVDAQDINFKFSAEIFNNLDIVQNKFGEPVRYGDIIMLMHENTHMFIQYVNSTKTLTFSNHDGDATLFIVQPATEYMLNDNQILKAGQPIRLKVAGFNYASQNLFFGLSVPYSTSNKKKEIEENENEDNMEDEKVEEDQLGESSDELFSKEDNNTTEKLFYDKRLKKYIEKPDLVVEENSTMNWRFVLYNPFTTKEDLILFGDFIQIMYCDQNSVLGAISEEKEEQKKATKELKKSVYKNKRRESFDLKENILVPDDDEIIIDDINDSDLMINKQYKNSEFYLSHQTPYNKNSTEDVNSTWIIESAYPYMKMQSFIRFYEDEKLDTYRMTFRIRHFKTNKILSIAESKDEKVDLQGVMKGVGTNEKKSYKFVLIDDIIEKSIDEKKMLSTEYQYSLFGFKKTNKSKSDDSTKPSINDFLKLYHVKTQSYIKIITSEQKKKNLLSFDEMLKCDLTLIKYPDEKEVVKIERLHYNTQWKFKFVQNLYNLTCYIVKHLKQELGETKKRDLYLNDNINNENNPNENLQIMKHEYMNEFSGEEYLEVSMFVKLKFVLDKLFKFILNKFINKFNDYCGFSNVVNNRQLLISHFDFTKLFLVDFIHFYWFHDNNLGRIRKIENILKNVNKGQEINNYLNKLTPRDKALYQMFRYTEAIFQFVIIYCKDNSIIKKDLYQHLYVFFNFINLSQACVDALIEIFKNEESNLNFLIRDCIEKKEFKNTLNSLFREYFPDYLAKCENPVINMNNFIDTNTKKNNNQQDNIITLFDLVLEFVKISEYSYDPKYDDKLIKNNADKCSVISFNPREKYIQLLITLVHMDNKTNIQDNQFYLIKKLIKQWAGNYILDPTMFGIEINYPPCLINLIYELAKDSRIDDENNVNSKDLKILHEFILHNTNFSDDNLIIDEEKQKNDKATPPPTDVLYSCNSKMFTYIKENKSNPTDEENVCKFFAVLSERFKSSFFKKNTWNINFLDNEKIEMACSVIQFMKNMIQIDLLSPQKEKDFLNILISFLRLKYTIFSSEKVSNVIQGDMISKEKSILERIIKTEHEKYISISETWHRIYQIFRRVLINQIEDKYYQKEKEVNNYGYLNPQKQGDQTKAYNKETVENEENNINMNSQDKLIEPDENNSLKGKNEKEKEREKENNNTLEDDQHSESDNRNGAYMAYKKNNNNLFDLKEGENRNYETITREDLKKEKKILLIKNIVEIFKLLIRKNINYLKKNFIEYYLHKTNNNDQFNFEEFVQRCIPCLEDGNENINRLIRKYCKAKVDYTISSIGYINLNNFFDSSKTDDLNFIQNIIISFATSEEEETQEILIGLIYKYFHQRRTLLRDIIQFNEHLLPDNQKKVRDAYSSKGQDIKTIFNQFYQNYELNKNKYDADKPEKIEFFLNSLIREISIVFEHIFAYWKAELIFKENNSYDKKKLDFMINKINIIKFSISQPHSQEIFLNNLSQVSYFLYYIRNNSEEQFISSIINILNEHGEIYMKMFFSLLNDLINKGKKISSYFVVKKLFFFANKNILSSSLGTASNDVVLSIKNKYFICLILLILLSSITLPRDDKTLSYLFNLLEDKKDLLKYDSYTRYLILLLITDMQKFSFSVDYFFIFKKCNEFLNTEYFGKLDSSSDYNSVYPICFSSLYLDIIYNVLSFIIYKNKMINETYLDEIIADTFLLLLKKMNIVKAFDKNDENLINEDPESKDKIKLLIKLIKTINLMSNVEQLNKVIMLKIDPMNTSNFNNELINYYFNKLKKNNLIESIRIDHYYPQPHNLYQLFINNLHELYNDTGHKLTEERGLRYAQNIFELYKYILYYITFIDPN